LLCASLLGLTFGLKANAVNRRVDFGNAEDLANAFAQRNPLAQVNGFTSKASRLGETLGNQIPHDDNGCSQ
jgi:hypothetical protein